MLKQQQASTGQSWRVRYSKDFAGAGTNFSLAGYRYNSKGFYTLEDTMESYTRASDWSAPQQRRARTEATVDQTLGESWGVFYAESGQRDLLEPAPGYDLHEPQLQQQLAWREL
ncbi:fimbrial usher protein [Citrobacter koseri]|uniref:Fimbrial usher protein n=1 Tax=Citrobacter koseri TaxID=545 RepID=A0A2X2VAM0_CITKO|nr:fimbrial usher protein [Citrobacter koseri]